MEDLRAKLEAAERQAQREQRDAQLKVSQLETEVQAAARQGADTEASSAATTLQLATANEQLQLARADMEALKQEQAAKLAEVEKKVRFKHKMWRLPPSDSSAAWRQPGPPSSAPLIPPATHCLPYVFGIIVFVKKKYVSGCASQIDHSAVSRTLFEPE